jgi:hypothetical protein
MAKSIEVSLPRSHPARFPDRCVVCDCPAPDSHVRIVTGSIGWWTWLLWSFGKAFAVKAPACSRCAWRLHIVRFASLLATIAAAAAALWFIWPHFKDSIPRHLQKWAMMALAVVCILPQIIFEVFVAAPFDLTADADSVDYEFTSESYATEFAMLNQDAAWVKVNGAPIS